MSGLYGNGIVLSEKVLGHLWARQTMTLNNIANVDTPGFKPQNVSFEDELGQRLRRASAGMRPGQSVGQALRQSQAHVNTIPGASSRLDGNNVDMDQEQIELVRAAYQYQFMVCSINGDINRLRNAAKSF